ncbi:uncharacterized protein J3R85_006538 [Psidium guajava]|nr:uncharacterized protein J3R85_006538 [Psidium guajava]
MTTMQPEAKTSALTASCDDWEQWGTQFFSSSNLTTQVLNIHNSRDS